ncbi:hypothetical protein [Mesobacillus subterraneus]|uniref:Uncharacterized protein n=1 Tax=Mesobacillus subterraneus TaxID=285983 RepID=A0A427TXN8_9BACI|nr:hypothetical protein [Mesobacillus subterraneus]RSD29066.1 hypothetical protein EJA10_02870 [Mesobacillus subterraneus]
MKTSRFFLILLILIITAFLTACSKGMAFEITKAERRVTETDDRIQLELEYEIINHSNEDYFFTLVFPSYIQDALITKVGINKLPGKSSTSNVEIINIRKDSAEMTDETIEAILNGDIPIVQEILIGTTISLN